MKKMIKNYKKIKRILRTQIKKWGALLLTIIILVPLLYIKFPPNNPTLLNESLQIFLTKINNLSTATLLAIIAASLFILPKKIETISFYLWNYYINTPILTTAFLVCIIIILQPFQLLIAMLVQLIMTYAYVIARFTNRAKDLTKLTNMDTDLAPVRTTKLSRRVLTYLKTNNVINISGKWGSGKTDFLKRIQAIISENDNQISIFISLDQLDSTEKIVSAFESKLSSKIHSESGIILNLEVSDFIEMFSSNDQTKLLQKLITEWFFKPLNLIDSMAAIPKIRDKEWIIIIDDLDRVLSISEIKFVLEFITFLREASPKFKVIFSSNNEDIIHPMLGYTLLEATGMSTTKITRAIRAAYKDPGFINNREVHQEAKLLGSEYLDKYRDGEIKIPEIDNKNLNRIFLQQLQDKLSFPDKIMDPIKKTFSATPLPFEGDFRSMKSVISVIESINIEEIINLDVLLNDVIIIAYNIARNPQVLVDIQNGQITFDKNKGDVRIGNKLLEHRNLFTDKQHKNSIMSQKSTFNYQKAFSSTKVHKLEFTDIVEVSG